MLSFYEKLNLCVFSFVLGAVSPAVVVPSMLILQAGGYGVEKGVPTLLMAAGSIDDILAITGFNTCLGMAFSSGMLVNLYVVKSRMNSDILKNVCSVMTDWFVT